MAECIEQSRVACALGGIYTALAIDRVLPVNHTGPGCLAQAADILGRVNGGQSPIPFEESVVPCTDFCNTDVVFGGGEHLRTVIEKAIEYYDADLIIAVDGCTAEIVGDDIEEVAESFEGSRIPVISAKLPGFVGNNLFGHSQILKSIINQFLEPTDEVDPLQVNVFGIVPFYDTFWQGTLEKLEELLRAIGLHPNIIYGHGHGIENVKKIPSAGFNLVLAPWIDLDIAELLEKKFGTPYLQFDNVPIGPTETTKFIRTLVDYAHLDQIAAESYIRKNEDRFYYYISRQQPFVYACKYVPKDFYFIGSASAAVSITRFMVNDIGSVPLRIYITDNVPKERQEAVRASLYDVELEDKDYEIIFTEDGGLAEAELRKEHETRSVIFGSNWDLLTARALGCAFVPVCAPYGQTLIGTKNYFGYEGGVSLFADYYGEIATNPQVAFIG